MVVGGLLVALLFLGASLAVQRLASGLCASTEVARLPAPDARHDAVLFERNCGATTDFASHVSLLPAGAPLGNATGTVFIAEAGAAGARAAWGGPPVTIDWDADGALVIRYDATAEVFHAATEVDGVAVRANTGP